MRYTNRHFTYLLTYLHDECSECIAPVQNWLPDHQIRSEQNMASSKLSGKTISVISFDKAR